MCRTATTMWGLPRVRERRAYTHTTATLKIGSLEHLPFYPNLTTKIPDIRHFIHFNGEIQKRREKLRTLLISWGTDTKTEKLEETDGTNTTSMLRDNGNSPETS